MKDLLQKMAKASWKNEDTFSSDLIDRWLDNFKGVVYKKEDEDRLALWLLCNFTYYNEDEINHLSHIVYKSFLHDLVNYFQINSQEDLDCVFGNVFFAAVGDASESGGLQLYYFRQQSNIGLDKFYYPSSLPDNKNAIYAFIDDVTLSGDSAVRFFNNNLLKKLYERVYYLTLFASQEAIEKISSIGITVISSTIIGEREKCFSKQSLVFEPYPELREITKRMVKEYGRKLSYNNPLGHKDGQYCFGLHYNTPNNTLPIFWSSNNWSPVFPRKEKIYHDKGNVNYEKYI